MVFCFVSQSQGARDQKSTHNCHVGIHLDAEIVKIRVSVPLEHTNTMVDGIDALLGASNSEFDHGSSLKKLVMRLQKSKKKLA